MAVLLQYAFEMPQFKRGGVINSLDAEPEVAGFYRELVGAEETAERWALVTEEIQQQRKDSEKHVGPSDSRADRLKALEQSFAAASSSRMTSSNRRAAAQTESESGVGYALLTKAGWKGGGLGAQGQGITAPIPAWFNQGRQGIGSAQRSRPATDAQAVTPGSTVAARSAARLGIGEVQAGPKQAMRGAPKRQQAARAARAPKREWETVAVTEDVESKVKRVKQVMQAEADEAAGRALSRALYRAFKGDSGGHGSTDSNPLLRRSKLSDSNPLL